MNLIPDMLPEALIRALGWTLLHSLWQGAALALLLGLLLLLLHRHAARTRYAVAGSAMLAQLLLAMGTFTYYLSTTGHPEAGSTVLNAPAGLGANPLTQHPFTFWQDPFGVAQTYFEQHLPLLVTAWLLGVLLMVLRLLGGVAYAQRLRNYKVAPLAQNWQHALHRLSKRIGLSQTVRLVESGLVKAPMAIGFAKPVILLPIGAVTGLSQQQVEAILAHELAHIVRKDYLLNLLQSAVDTLFFYHPATWWVSGIVREERENCCDDIAVALCGDTLTYARALAELEAMRLPGAPAMAMAFSGQRGSLMSRIKRLVGQQSLRPTFSEGFLAALVLVIGLMGLSFGAVAGLRTTQQGNSNEKAMTVSPVPSLETPAPDTAFAEAAQAEEATTAFTYQVQQGSGNAQDIVIIKNKKGKITELYVNGKRIPKKDIPQYSALIDQRLEAVAHAPKATPEQVRQTLAETRAAATKARRRARQEVNYSYNFRFDGDTLLPPPPPPVPGAPAVPPVPALAPMPPAPPAPPVPPLGKKELSKEDEEAYGKVLKEYQTQLEAYEQEVRELYREDGPYMQQLKAHASQQRAQARKQVAIAQRQAALAKHHAAAAQKHAAIARARANKMKAVQQEMVKDGLIKDETKNLSIQLNDDGLYINGKKQSDQMYQKYRTLMQPPRIEKDSTNLQLEQN